MSGTFEEEFPTSAAGAQAAAQWFQEKTTYIHTNFDDWCKGFGDECSKTLVIIRPSAVPASVPAGSTIRYQIDFEVICYKSAGDQNPDRPRR